MLDQLSRQTDIKYLPPFDVVRRSLTISTVKGELRVSVSYEDFIRIVKLLLAAAEIDESWYLERYDDIREAVDKGEVPSARKHFATDGYFEGRLPFPLMVDEDWYLSRYPDVAEGIRTGAIASATQHFITDGYREGRLPRDI
jgi:hypothetical protein